MIPPRAERAARRQARRGSWCRSLGPALPKDLEAGVPVKTTTPRNPWLRGRDQRRVGGPLRASCELLPRGTSREVAGAAAMEAQEEKEAQVMGGSGDLWPPGNGVFDTLSPPADVLDAPCLLFSSLLLCCSIFSPAFRVCEPLSA